MCLLIISLYISAMTDTTPSLEIGFLLSDTSRILRRIVDQRAKEVGMSRAQWAVLTRISRYEGLRQVDLAAQMEMEPISVGRIIDRLQASGLVERRPDPADRRAYRLHLLPAAEPVLAQVRTMGSIVMDRALAKLDETQINALAEALQDIRTNLLNIDDTGEDHAGQSDEESSTRPVRRRA